MLGLIEFAKDIAQLRSPASVVSPRLSPLTVEHSAFTIGKNSALPSGMVQVRSALPSVSSGLLGSGFVVKVPPYKPYVTRLT